MFGASFSNHTGIADYKPIDPGRRRPDGARPLPRGRRAAPGQRRDDRRSAARGAPRRRSPRTDHPPEVAERRAIWLAEKSRRQADQSEQGIGAAAVMDSLTPTGRRRRGDRRRRRQQHLLVRPVLRGVRPPGRRDVRLPRLDRLLAPRGDGRLGRVRQRAPDRQRERRRRVRPVRDGAHDGGEVRDEHHPRHDEQRRARQDLEGAARRRTGTSGRRRSTTPTSRRSPSCAARRASG